MSCTLFCFYHLAQCMAQNRSSLNNYRVCYSVNSFRLLKEKKTENENVNFLLYSGSQRIEKEFLVITILRKNPIITKLINRIKKMGSYRSEAPSILSLLNFWTSKVQNEELCVEMCHLISIAMGKERWSLIYSNIARFNLCRVFGSKSTCWVSLGSTSREACRRNLLHPAHTSEQMGFYTVPSRGLFFLLWKSCLWL